MNWDALGAVGETLGAVAVLITLAYLAVQVRHAREGARRALSQGRGEALRSILVEQQDERINRLTLRANEVLGGQSNPFVTSLGERTGISAEDAMLLFWNQVSWWNYFLQIIPKINDLTSMERAQFEVPIRAFFGEPGVGRLFYESYIRTLGHPDAVRYIEQLLAEPPDRRASMLQPNK